MKIYVVIHPSSPVPFSDTGDRYRRLADAMIPFIIRKTSSCQIEFVGTLKESSPDSFILFAGNDPISQALADCGPVLAAQIAPRIILLGRSWQTTLEKLNKHHFAGAVDSRQLWEWESFPDSGSLWGLRWLAPKIGAVDGNFATPMADEFCMFQTREADGLPRLLADYLAAYAVNVLV